MLRRRDIKAQNEQNEEQKAPESQTDTQTAEPQAAKSNQENHSGTSSGPSGAAWKPMRQTNEEWKPQRSTQIEGDESIVGPDDFFNGAYKSQRGVRVQGRVEGSIESKGHVLVEEQAQVMADMSAEDITVAGRFNGKVDCRRRFEITPTGVVTGEINTDLLVVQEGGFFDGKLKMKDRGGIGRGSASPAGSAAGGSRPAQGSASGVSSPDEDRSPSQV